MNRALVLILIVAPLAACTSGRRSPGPAREMDSGLAPRDAASTDTGRDVLLDGRLFPDMHAPPMLDAGSELDAGTSDAGGSDAGGSDIGAPDVGSPDAGGVGMRLANYPFPCAERSRGSLSPVLPEESGHYTASVFTPPGYPFVVSSVNYSLGKPSGGAAQCDGGLAHRVQVYLVTSGRPTRSPSTDSTLVETFDISASPTSTFRTVAKTLTSPVRLERGQSLVVAVQLLVDPRNSSRSLCLASCGTSANRGVDYWSNAAREPYSWADLVLEFGFTSNNEISVYGELFE